MRRRVEKRESLPVRGIVFCVFIICLAFLEHVLSGAVASCRYSKIEVDRVTFMWRENNGNFFGRRGLFPKGRHLDVAAAAFIVCGGRDRG